MGSPLEAWRRERGLTQEQLAKEVGLRSKGYISAIESGGAECSLRLALKFERLSEGKVRAATLRPNDPELAERERAFAATSAEARA